MTGKHLFSIWVGGLTLDRLGSEVKVDGLRLIARGLCRQASTGVGLALT